MLPVTLLTLIAVTPATGAIAGSPAAAAADPALQVWLSRRDNVDFGDHIRVYVRAEQDGYLVVLHADAEGRVRVLFPVDPFKDDYIRGGRDYEVRDRSDHEAIRVVDATGFGYVYAAYSTDPFAYAAFARNDHWDYRTLGDIDVNGDPEAALTELAERMAAPGQRFEYDIADYYVTAPVVSRRHYQRYSAWYYDPYYYDPYWYPSGVRFGININIGSAYPYPYYYRFYPYRSYYYDPFSYYDPFYYGSYDPFYYGPRYAYGYYRVPRYRTVVHHVYGTRTYATVHQRFGFRDRSAPATVDYRRRLSAPGALVANRQVARTGRPVVSGRTRTVGIAAGRAPATSSGAAVAPGRRPAPAATAGRPRRAAPSAGNAATSSRRPAPTAARGTTGRTAAPAPQRRAAPATAPRGSRPGTTSRRPVPGVITPSRDRLPSDRVNQGAMSTRRQAPAPAPAPAAAPTQGPTRRDATSPRLERRSASEPDRQGAAPAAGRQVTPVRISPRASAGRRTSSDLVPVQGAAPRAAPAAPARASTRRSGADARVPASRVVPRAQRSAPAAVTRPAPRSSRAVAAPRVRSTASRAPRSAPQLQRRSPSRSAPRPRVSASGGNRRPAARPSSARPRPAPRAAPRSSRRRRP